MALQITADAIRELREKRSWSRRDLATALNIDEATVFRWEKGDPSPSGATYLVLITLLTAAGVKLGPQKSVTASASSGAAVGAFIGAFFAPPLGTFLGAALGSKLGAQFPAAGESDDPAQQLGLMQELLIAHRLYELLGEAWKKILPTADPAKT